MRKFASYLLFGALGVVLVVFFFANRKLVHISMDPFDIANPAVAIGPMPLWATFAVFLLIGFFLGSFGMWLTAGTLRRKAQERKKEIRRLKEELALAAGDTPRKSRLPALRR